MEPYISNVIQIPSETNRLISTNTPEVSQQKVSSIK